MITKALGITLVMLGIAFSIVTKLYIDKVEEFGKLEVSYEVQRGETEKALAQIEGLKLQHTAQLEKFDLIQTERKKDEVRYAKDIKRINKMRSTSEAAALKEPERFGVIATYRLRRSLRGICSDSGGSRDDCKIEIPKSTKTKSSPALKSNTNNNDGIVGGGKEGDNTL